MSTNLITFFFSLFLFISVDSLAQVNENKQQPQRNVNQMMLQEIRINPKDTATMRATSINAAFIGFVLDTNAKIYTSDERDSLVKIITGRFPEKKD